MAFASKSLTSGDLFGWREPVLPPGRTERLVDGVEHWLGEQAAGRPRQRPGAAARGAARRGRPPGRASSIADRGAAAARRDRPRRAQPQRRVRGRPRRPRRSSRTASCSARVRVRRPKAMRRVVPRDILERLTPGDIVVHIDHGIARYEQMLRRGEPGEERDYLELIVRGRRPDLRPGRADQPRLALLGRRAPAALAPRRHRLAADEAAGPQGGQRPRRGAARPVREARGGRRASPYAPDSPWQMRDGGVVPVRGDARPAAGGRSRSRSTWRRAGRWTGWSSATSATARPRSRCGPRSRRPRTASRSRCSCRRPCSPGSTSQTFSQRFAAFPLTVRLLSRFVSAQGAGGDGRGARGRDGRHRDRHPPAAVEGRRVPGPRPGRGRRGAAVRRRGQGAAQAAPVARSTC